MPKSTVSILGQQLAKLIGVPTSKVDQHSSWPDRLNMAILGSARADELCTNEIVAVLLDRLDKTNGLEFVDDYPMFELWVKLDQELQQRKDLKDSENTVSIPSVVDDDEDNEDIDHDMLDELRLRGCL